jgi:predicted  nucleic acid-binding Zn-ribbon protein
VESLEVIAMSLGQTQYFYTVELTALEEHLSLSKDRVARLREKAMKRKDYGAADQIDQLQREIDIAHRRIESLK